MSKVECPLNIGQRVTVSRSVPFCGDWPGEYNVTAIQWEYNKGDGRQFNISIASDEEIHTHCGDTDGFSVADLISVDRLAAKPADERLRKALQEIADTDQYPDSDDTAAELREIARNALSTTGEPKS